MRELIETDWGIANTYTDRIEINKELVNYPKLREKILKHEFEHAQVKKKGLKGFMKDRKIDALTELKFMDILPFIWKRPKTWVQFLPITYSKRNDTIYFDWSLIFLYSAFFFMFYLPSRFIIKYYGFNFFLQVVPITIIILIMIVVVRNLAKKLVKKINKEYSEAEKNSKRKYKEVSRKADKEIQKIMKK